MPVFAPCAAGRARHSHWIIGSAVSAAAWLVGVFLPGAASVFRNARTH